MSTSQLNPLGESRSYSLAAFAIPKLANVYKGIKWNANVKSPSGVAPAPAE